MERIEMQLMFKLSIVMQAIVFHPQMESLKEFLENSTIHGLCYISTSRFKTFNHSIWYIFYISTSRFTKHLIIQYMLQIWYRPSIQFMHKIIHPKHVIIQFRSNTGKIYNLCYISANRTRTGKVAWFLIVCASLAKYLQKIWILYLTKNWQKLCTIFLFFNAALTYFLQKQ